MNIRRRTGGQAGPAPKRQDTFAALKVSRNFRLYVLGQVISQAGTWMQAIAIGWYVLTKTHSGTMVGLVSATQFAPMMLFGAWAGVLADRFDKRKTLMFTQSLMGTAAFLLWVITSTNVAHMWMVFCLTALLGVGNALDMPARGAFVVEMVGPEYLANALSLNAVTMNISRIAGPSVAGAIITWFGVTQCFLLNSISFAAVIFALSIMRTADLFRADRQPRRKGQLREGFSYVRQTPSLRIALSMMFVIGMLTYETQVALPLFAKITFHGSAGTYSIMSAIIGVGSVVGGLATAGSPRTGVRVVIRQAMLLGSSYLLLAACPTLVTACIALLFTGYTSISYLARASATLQLESDPSMRGRVVALWAVAMQGTTPIGGPIIGFIGEHVSPRFALLTSGAAAIGAAMYGTMALRLHHDRMESQASNAGATPAAAAPAAAASPG